METNIPPINMEELNNFVDTLNHNKLQENKIKPDNIIHESNTPKEEITNNKLVNLDQLEIIVSLSQDLTIEMEKLNPSLKPYEFTVNNLNDKQFIITIEKLIDLYPNSRINLFHTNSKLMFEELSNLKSWYQEHKTEDGKKRYESYKKEIISTLEKEKNDFYNNSIHLLNKRFIIVNSPINPIGLYSSLNEYSAIIKQGIGIGHLKLVSGGIKNE